MDMCNIYNVLIKIIITKRKEDYHMQNSNTNSIDVVFTFDTTGSMYPCISQVKRTLKETISKLFKDIKDLRIGIIAHGDYCDVNTSYVTRLLDLTNNIDYIFNFINGVERTHGGDAPECYELVLHQARTNMMWGSGRSKIIAMIGDDIPHEPHYPDNTLNIDWLNETGLIAEAGIKIYGIHAMPGCRIHSKPFYKKISEMTNGFYLTLDQFSTITNLIMAICYYQQGDDSIKSFYDKLENNNHLTRDIEETINTMRGKKTKTYKSKDGLIRVFPGRFQIFDIENTQDIKTFIENKGVEFHKGRGFYELTKSVKVQQYKEIILVHKTSGDIFNGEQVRTLLNLNPQTTSGGITERLNQKHLMNDYLIFIQSTSYNRKLLSNTKFLYEVDDWSKAHDVILTDRTPIKKRVSKRLARGVIFGEGKSKMTIKKGKKTIKKTLDIKPKITIPERLLNAKKAYDVKLNNPDMTWNEVALRTSYSSGDSARKAANRIKQLIK